MRNLLTSLLSTIAVVDVAAAQWSFRNVSGPPATINAVMIYDDARGRCLLFNATPVPQTWSYDGVSWQQLAPAHTPPGRRYTQLTYDLVRNVAVLYGGSGPNVNNGLAADETWEWNGTDWTQVQPTSTPGGIERYAAAFDVMRQRLVLYGGMRNSWIPTIASSDTWEYDGTAWYFVPTATRPGPLELASACFDLATSRTVLFGGRNPAGLGTLTDDTWTYDGVDWQLVNVAGPRPQVRIQAQFVYDLQRGVCVLFGGRDPSTMAVLDDLWTFDGVAWRQVLDVTSGIYPPRVEGAMALDRGRHRLVYYGGRTASTAMLDETWEYGANFHTFGSGCAGSNGVPRLGTAQEPRLGSSYGVTLSNLPASPLAMLATGISNASWAFGSLPSLLTPFGMPGCRSYTSADLIQVLPVTAGIAIWTWSVPNNPGLVGTPFYQQGVAIDAGINAAGLTVSNAGASVIGW